MLEIRKNRFAKWYENAYFRVLANKLISTFNELELDGVLIGSGFSEQNTSFQPDILLVCETAVIIIDLKKYSGRIQLPESCVNAESKRKDTWYQGKWILNEDKQKWVKGGSRINPFQQLVTQTKKLSAIVEERIVPFLQEGENCEIKDTQRIVCFQLEVDLQGEVDPRYSHNFHVADSRSIVERIRDIVDISPNVWEGHISGYKLSWHAFNLFKKEFKADLFDPSTKTQLYDEEEFEQIVFPQYESDEIDLLVNREFEDSAKTLIPFIKGEKNVLVINSDRTSFSFEIVDRILNEIVKEKKLEDEEIDHFIDSSITHLAPSNKNVQDAIRDGAPYCTRSLYGKLYDYEHSKIELHNNSINEREEFPLQKNNDPEGMVYIIYYAHLIYNFGEPDQDALLKFGSGSLCNDTISYINPTGSHNRLILVNDPYFYGYRADSITKRHILETNNLNYISLNLQSRPSNIHESNIADLRKNIDNKSFNNFRFGHNDKITLLDEKQFGEIFRDNVITGGINEIHILTRENDDAIRVNNWIRKHKDIDSNEVQAGDIILIKGARIIVPEDRDPFALPKFVQNGDIAEILAIIERYSFHSKKYNFPNINVCKCRVYLKDYDVERILYLSSTAIPDTNSLPELKKHIQIRLREIVDHFLSEHNISTEDVFDVPEEYQSYMAEYDKHLTKKGIFPEKELIEIDKDVYEKSLKKLNSKWKINKRKENYIRSNLLNDTESEYFKISQMAKFQFGWAINLRSAYGYRFDHSLLPKYSSAAKNIDRFHAYLYSGLITSNKLSLQDFRSINPWFSLSTKINLSSLPDIRKGSCLLKLKEQNLSPEGKAVQERFDLGKFDIRITILAIWVQDHFKSDDISIEKIVHHNYHEEYHFRKLKETCRIIFYYNDNWEVKGPKQVDSNNLGRIIMDQLSLKTGHKDEYPFIGSLTWNIKEYERLNDHIGPENLFISDIQPFPYKDRITITGEDEECQFDMIYNSFNLFTKLDFIFSSSKSVARMVIHAINVLKLEI